MAANANALWETGLTVTTNTISNMIIAAILEAVFPKYDPDKRSKYIMALEGFAELTLQSFIVIAMSDFLYRENSVNQQTLVNGIMLSPMFNKKALQKINHFRQSVLLI